MASTAIEKPTDAPKHKWGDEDFGEDDRDNGPQVIAEDPQKDGSVIKTIVEYRTNEDGKQVKITRKVRTFKKKIKINPHVETRKKWKKFGECTHVPPGPERGITTVGEEVSLDLARSSQSESDEKATKKDTANLGIICRNCGKTGDHWTLKCPFYKEKRTTSYEERSETTAASGSSDSSKVYRPPGARGASSGRGEEPDSATRGGPSRGGRTDETATIRVTNLSEETKEADLFELFNKFGPISRIYLAKDPTTGLSKGFAFVNFVHREDAARAIQKLSGFGYDHLILHIEWAKPSNK